MINRQIGKHIDERFYAVFDFGQYSTNVADAMVPVLPATPANAINCRKASTGEAVTSLFNTTDGLAVADGDKVVLWLKALEDDEAPNQQLGEAYIIDCTVTMGNAKRTEEVVVTLPGGRFCGVKRMVATEKLLVAHDFTDRLEQYDAMGDVLGTSFAIDSGAVGVVDLDDGDAALPTVAVVSASGSTVTVTLDGATSGHRYALSVYARFAHDKDQDLGLMVLKERYAVLCEG